MNDSDKTAKAAARLSLGPVALQILAHLSWHRDAQDTVEGITEWWSLEQRIRVRTTALQEGLAELVDRRMVVEQRGRDGRTHYKANRRRAKAVIPQAPRKKKGREKL